MEFDTGPEVQAGHDITLDTSSGSQDLGAATYDSDHDGVADSVIVIDGGHEYVITDSDQDGHADSIHAYDSTGHEVDPKTGAPVDGTADGSQTNTGNTSSHTGDTTGTETTGHSTGLGSAGTDSNGSNSSGTDSTGEHSGDSSSSTATGHDITVTGDDGSAHSIGAPTVDMDKDGSPDTAVVHNSDGSVTGYTDRDGDGNADQITQIDADGKVVIAVADGHGGWEVAAKGHIDSSGNLVNDDTSDATGTSHTGTSHTDTGASHAGTDTGAATTVPDSGSQAGDITFTDGGKDYDLGQPTADLNGDGSPDTVVTHLSDGTVLGYSDTDGDGTADQVTQISPDGQVVIGVSDGHGGWEQAATGHIGTDGKFVPDSSSAGVVTA